MFLLLDTLITSQTIQTASCRLIPRTSRQLALMQTRGPSPFPFWGPELDTWQLLHTLSRMPYPVALQVVLHGKIEWRVHPAAGKEITKGYNSLPLGLDWATMLCLSYATAERRSAWKLGVQCDVTGCRERQNARGGAGWRGKACLRLSTRQAECQLTGHVNARAKQTGRSGGV